MFGIQGHAVAEAPTGVACALLSLVSVCMYVQYPYINSDEAMTDVPDLSAFQTMSKPLPFSTIGSHGIEW